MNKRTIKQAYLFYRRPILDLYHFVRVQSQLTKLLGPQYQRSRSFIEIDITYKCNLRCDNCNRSCGQAPSDEEMTLEQIEAFVRESVDRNIKWKRIRVLGGEPTLHPHLFQMLEMVLHYKRNVDSDTEIVLVSNGHGPRVEQTLARVPAGIRIENSSKASGVQWFAPFNIAPRDTLLYQNADYSNGCWIMIECGMGYTSRGYYPCAIAGGIDRIFDFRLGRNIMPLAPDTMVDQLRAFCPLCGHFRFDLPTTRQKISPSWKAAYEMHEKRKSKGS